MTRGKGGGIKRLCQTCGQYVVALGNHVARKHNTTITDLVAEGKWKNESFYQC